MVKRSSLYRKLASYSALATAVLAVKKSDAQIVYTALSPNVKVYSSDTSFFGSESSYYLDLNNDGTPDFKFTVGFTAGGSSTYGNGGYGRSNFITAYAINENKVDSDKTDIYGSVIGTQNTWTERQLMALHYFRKEWFGTHIIFSGSGNDGNFYNESNRYLPLKLIKNGATYYGWVRVSCAGADTLTIKDYAYNTIPDSSIKAGYTGCSHTPVTPVISVKGDTLLSSKSKSYQWFLADSLLVSDTSGFISGIQGNYYSVLTTDSNGCIAQSTAYYFDSCLSAKPLIDNYAIDSACGGVYLTIPYPVPNTTIQWLLNGDSIAYATGTEYNADISGNYSAEFTNITEECSRVSNSIALTIYQEPINVFIYQICDTIFTSAEFTSPTTYQIQWYNSSGSLISDTSNNYLPPPQRGFYYLTYINGLCTTSGNNIYYLPFSDTAQFFINPSYNDFIYPGDSTTLSFVEADNFDSTTLYQWQYNGVDVGTNQYYYTTATPGAYTLNITSGGCTAHSNTIYLIMDTTQLSIIQKNDTLFATDTSLSGYNWYIDSALLDVFTYYYVPLANGFYNVLAYDSNYCYFFSKGYYYKGAGISIVNQLNDIAIYNYDKLLHVNLSDDNLLGSELKLYNALGQEVYATTLTTAQTEINLENLIGGLYIVRITGKNFVISKKIVIE